MYTTENILVGLELEGFAYKDGKKVNVLSEKDALGHLPQGSWTSDAGINQIEIINPIPQWGVSQACRQLRELAANLPKEWEVAWTARLPGHSSTHTPEWAEKARYSAMHQALAVECPDSWHLVKQMAAWSALHVNIGVSPWSTAGMLMMNLINNIGPYIGHVVRDMFPDSRGHFSVWRHWARSERLPRYGEWWMSPFHYGSHFRSLPRLIDAGSKEAGQCYVDMRSPRSIFNPIDLGTNWKLARPKRSPSGWYIELRVLPSMPLTLIELYVSELIRGVVAILNWSERRTRSGRIDLVEAQAALLSAAAASSLFRSTSLSEAEWNTFFVA